MSTLSQVTLLAAALAPFAWVLTLFYDQEGKLTFPGYGSPATGFGLLALFAVVQSSGVGAVAVVSTNHPEIRDASLALLAVSLLGMTGFSTLAYVFARSRLARAGVWWGLFGLASLLLTLASAPDA